MQVPVPDSGSGYTVSTHMLYSASQYLNDQAQAIARVRDSFNGACYAGEGAFGSGPARSAFNEFFTAWFSALDGQAETMGSVADATEQCAVLYDHAERVVLGKVPAMRTKPRPLRAKPPQDFPAIPFP
ncbi:MAG: hypothetical protein J2P25_18505 [Nocardiopsaceae bacterium]|nr:hypothetical protein [Nocardiopsaceae bacterium]